MNMELAFQNSQLMEWILLPLKFKLEYLFLIV